MLSQIMKRVNCQVQIYIGSDRPLDTTGKEPDESVLTIMRALEIDNDMVRNQLIINQAIEQTVLIEDSTQASHFMYGGQKPRNTKVVVAFSAERGGGIRYEFSRSGAAKSTPMKPWQAAARMQTDRAEQIRRAQENEGHARRDMEQLKQQARELQQTLKVAEQALFRWDRTNKELRRAKQQADDAVEAMQNEIENNRPQDGKIQELRTQLQSAIEDVHATQRSYQDGVDWKDRLNEQATAPNGLKAKADAALREYQTAKMQIEKAENRKAQLESDRVHALRSKNLALEEIELAKDRHRRAEEARDGQARNVEVFVGHAGEVCARVPVDAGVTTQMLDKRLEQFIAEYERVQREAGGTSEELTMAYLNAKREFRDARDQLSSMLDASNVSLSYIPPSDREHPLIDSQSNSRSPSTTASTAGRCSASTSPSAPASCSATCSPSASSAAASSSTTKAKNSTSKSSPT
jgi:hypothetical protein